MDEIGTRAASLKVKVEDGVITVTRPGTDFRLSYQRQSEARLLELTYSWVLPTMTSPNIAKFRTAAWEVACNKARELGWIV
jgi:hypothetical protein